MSNLERNPAELVCAEPDLRGESATVIPFREVPLGGPRAMTVRRTIPSRGRTFVGAWCFLDHYGPDDVSTSGGMQVPGHPHTGLATVSWLFSGEIEHRDTAGGHAFVRPSLLGLMIAGRGVAHSEFSTPTTTLLHGAQLWFALPEGERNRAPSFEEYVPSAVVGPDGITMIVFLGELAGEASPVRPPVELLGAELTIPAGRRATLPVAMGFEHGLLLDSGSVVVEGCEPQIGELVFVPPGRREIAVEAGPSGAARLLLLGGPPFGEEIVMWWNFVGRSHEEIVAFRRDWQEERETPGVAGERFGEFPWEDTLPAPELPNVRLKSRR